MILRSTALASVLLVAACAPRFDVNVSWTLDGVAASDACAAFASPSVAFRIDQQDDPNGPIVTENESASCSAGKSTIKSAAFSNLTVSLLENNDVFGATGPIALAPGAQSGGYAGENAGAPVLADIQLSRGKLHAILTVGGKDCGTAHASDFSVTLREESSPLAEDNVVSGKTVTCASDGNGGQQAVFDFDGIDDGSRYDVVATTTIAGVNYTTSNDGIGAGVVAQGAVTNLVVDLEPQP
jgi:hypothetical protein